MNSRPTYVEIDLEAIRHNISAIKKRVGPDVRIMPAVKADAYGHGAVCVSRAMLDAGADSLGIACIEEGIELREAGIEAPMLILGCSTVEAIPDILNYNIAATVCDIEFGKRLAEEAGRQGKLAAVHVKVDTGMGRIGVTPPEAKQLVRELAGMESVLVEGIFTHFPCSDSEEKVFTKKQIKEFSNLITDLENEGIHIPLRHAANSGGVLDHPDSFFNLVRPGIIAYGLYPSCECSRDIDVRPVMALKTAIVFLKEIEPGTTVSYGRTFTAKRRTKVATLPIGYADGYNRQLSNKGKAVVRGVVVPIIGRVCMDQMMIDVTDIPDVQPGDEAALYGGMIDKSISVEEVARLLNTIPYEVTCWVSKRVPRVYING